VGTARLKRRLAAVVVLALAAAAAGGYFSGLWRFNSPSREEFPIRGVDVSHHQGAIDWPAVAEEGNRFAYIKATEGGDFKDPAFQRNWDGAKASGIAVGAYHFFTFCRPGAEQARNFIAAVPAEAGALPPVIDFEFAGNCAERPAREAVLKELSSFSVLVGERYGKKPVLYAAPSAYARYLAGRTDGYRVWLRQIFYRPGKLDGRDWAIWQYSDNSHVRGINGLADQNAFNGREGDFAAYLAR
jgi:lysozyme